MRYLYVFHLLVFVFVYSETVFACTVFHTQNKNGNVLVGRSFDWHTEGGNVWFIPGEQGENSITIFEQYGISMPFEGVNNKGLFIAIASVPEADTSLNLLKPMRKSLEMISIALKQADDVDAALKIFPQYTVIFGKFLGYPLVHYKLVDVKGNSAIVEYANNEIKIVRDPKKCQVMANHYNSDESLDASDPLYDEFKTSFDRYRIASDRLTSKSSIKDIQSILKSVSQGHTKWANTYDLVNNKVFISYEGSKAVEIDLESEMYSGSHGYSLTDLEESRQSLEYNEERSVLLVRPHFGTGTMDGETTSHVGARILLKASDVRKYGLELTSFDSDDNNFTSIGIVLEQRLGRWFHQSIGTIGYFGYGEESEDVIGLTASFGWEPDNSIPFKPFAVFRKDLIFDGKDDVGSISLGFAYSF
ncbi:MAG: linear amide C-N hydrolase [Nitrospinota bacterium]